MKALLLVLVAAAAILTGCGNKHSSKPASSTNSTAGSTNGGSIATAPVDYLGTLVKADKSMTKTIDVSYLNEAVQQFNVQEGHYPKDLQELVPNYVAQLPTPPFGYKLDYDANSGIVKVVQQ
ncbi:MAG: hypothetical protein ABSD57_09290 [Verrucomicrobiota bacterium]|jgi:ABC-type enterochelin transport system substrate-binding protein